jgi:prepilin-type N-terminal cleavage/methylation domain-containing protein
MMGTQSLVARKRCRTGDNGGFTLIEVIVVLAIVAGLLAIAYAAIIPGYARVRAAYERDDLERQLLELPQRVRLSGYGGILNDRSGDNLPDDAIIAVEGVSEAEKSIEDWRVLRLSLPAGWRMRVAAPILYHFSGSCEGGEIAFASASAVLRYELAAPLCRPISRDAAGTS